jgi:hypothetical protein
LDPKAFVHLLGFVDFCPGISDVVLEVVGMVLCDCSFVMLVDGDVVLGEELMRLLAAEM